MIPRNIYVHISGDVCSVIDRESKLTTTTAYMNHILREYFTMKGLLPAETAVRKYSFPLSESDYEDCKKYLDINKFSDIDTYIRLSDKLQLLNSPYLHYGSNRDEAQMNVNEYFMMIFEDLVKSFEVTSYDFDDILEFSKVFASEKYEAKKRQKDSVSENDAIILDEDIMTLKGEPVDTRRLDRTVHLIEKRFRLQYSEAEKVYTSAFNMLFNYLSKCGVKLHDRESQREFYFMVFFYVDFKLALKHKEVPLSDKYIGSYCLPGDYREIVLIFDYIEEDITPETTTDELHQ